MTRSAGAALLACSALLALTAPARPQGACSYATSGYLTGLPYQLPVTYLTPGVADWKVAVPLPMECAGAGGQAAGQEALACDHDARPGVRAERGGLHVRRAGWLRGYATVQLTVYCVFPYPPAPLNAVLTAQPNMFPARPNALPAVPNRSTNVTEPALRPTASTPQQSNRSKNVTEPALPPTASTPQQSNDTVSSIATTNSPELSSSSDEEEEDEEESEEDSEVKSEDNRRLL